ncbi:CAMK family protein kinase [Tritrichomonas foetus]|uniref:CAMK family protein kinase n=1 Tax=Tritrichomonas foetus TaxID=1144522 RepID=A0A1J4J5B9_9EUKA|nr:CAMK family protein kinase [Tritrichomonas foetus]|eukprot:OHS93889.1 CAMK family protein kinase [Tritrichomonas foetus]
MQTINRCLSYFLYRNKIKLNELNKFSHFLNCFFNSTPSSKDKKWKSMEKHKTEIITELERKGYKLLQPIGNGGFATVYTVLNIHHDQIFCVKLMELTNEEHKSSLPQSFRAEIDSLINLIHPHVVAIFDYFQSKNMLYIILEYCQNGSLDSLIKDCGKIEPPHLFTMCKQIISALSICHQTGIAHRDIKPQNILLDQHHRPKLADFGLAQKLQKQELIERFSGSLPYKAPEILNMKPYDPFLADVWALGVTFVVMATGTLPWKANSLSEWKFLVSGGPANLPQGIDKRFNAIIKRMLDPNISTRATLEEVAAAPIFNLEENNKFASAMSAPTSKQLLVSTLSMAKIGVDKVPSFSMGLTCGISPISSSPTGHMTVAHSCVFARKRRCSKVKKMIQYTFTEETPSEDQKSGKTLKLKETKKK